MTLFLFGDISVFCY